MDTNNGWRTMFEQGRGQPVSRGMGGAPPAPPDALDLDGTLDPLVIDMADYKPWVLQRGRSRPVMLLHLRRYEPKSGLWMGWQLAYHSLVAAEYVGDTMLSLDFGLRQFMIEGRGLDELARHLQAGSVTAVQEHSRTIWPSAIEGSFVRAIRKIGHDQPET